MKDRDLLFGTLAIQRGYATAADVASCIREQAQGLAKGQVLRLGQVMVRRKFLTPAEFMELLEEQEQQILVCETCNKRYNVSRYEAGKRVRCRGCRSVLVVPNDLDAIIDGELIDLADDGPPVVKQRARRSSRQVARLEQGDRIGDHEVLGSLGSGGMGSVFLAREPEGGEQVALKIVRDSEASKRGQFAARFRREVAILKRLEHPAIVEVRSVGKHNGRPFFTMELLTGGSLHERLEAADEEGRAELIFDLIEIADGLDAAHRRRIVHRDLKPANVLYDAEGRVRLTDFGLSRDLEGETMLTQTGQVVGTPHYMSPEQILGDEGAIGPPADVYALGVILYQLLTGELPHQAQSAIGLYSQVLEADPIPPSQLAADVDPALEAVAMRAMAKDPDDRHASAGAFAEAMRFALDPAASVEEQLSALLESSDGDPYSTASEDRLPARPAPSRRIPPARRAPFWTRPRLLMLAAAVLLAFIGGAIIGVRNGERRSNAAAYLAAAEQALATGSYREALGYQERAQQAGGDRALIEAGRNKAQLALAALELREASARGDDERARDALGRYLARLAAPAVEGFAEQLPMAVALQLEPSGPPRDVFAWPVCDDQSAAAVLEGEPVRLGATPLRVRLPRGRYLLRLGAGESAQTLPIRLNQAVSWRPAQRPLAGMIYVPRYPGDEALEPFWIARREVTVREYYRWLDGLPAEERRLRRPRGRRSRWSAQLPQALADQPIRGVSWHDALAYALDHGMRLPSAREWERAFGANHGFRTPWLTAPEVREQPLAVGMTADDRSPFGVLGMGAGAREWVGGLNRERQGLLIGGSWLSPARPLQRSRRGAKAAPVDAGLRLARSAIPEPVGSNPGALLRQAYHTYYGVQIEALRLLVSQHPSRLETAAALVAALGANEPVCGAARRLIARAPRRELAAALASLAAQRTDKLDGLLRELAQSPRGGTDAVLILLEADAQPDGLGGQALRMFLRVQREQSRSQIDAALARLASRGEAGEASRRRVEGRLKIHQDGLFAAASRLESQARQRGDWSQRVEALRKLDWALALDPAMKDGWRLRAELHSRGADGVRFGRGADLEAALEDYGRLLALDPGYHDARVQRARIYLQLDKPGAGLAELAEAARSRRNDPTLQILGAELQMAKGDPAAALVELAKAAKQVAGPTALDVAIMTARCHARLGQAERARQLGADLPKRFPAFAAEATFGHALTLADLGDKAAALERIESVLADERLDPRVAAAARSLRRALRRR